MEAMQRVMEGRTTVMIAHRLSTLDVCDARLVLDQGCIAEAEGHIQVIVPCLAWPPKCCAPVLRTASCPASMAGLSVALRYAVPSLARGNMLFLQVVLFRKP